MVFIFKILKFLSFTAALLFGILFAAQNQAPVQFFIPFTANPIVIEAYFIYFAFFVSGILFTLTFLALDNLKKFFLIRSLKKNYKKAMKQIQKADAHSAEAENSSSVGYKD